MLAVHWKGDIPQIRCHLKPNAMRSPIARPALSVYRPIKRPLNRWLKRWLNRPLYSMIGAAAVVVASACSASTSTGPIPSRANDALPAVPATGELAMIVSVPESTPAAVTIDGPGGFSRSLTRTGILKGLAPGRYTVAAGSVTGASGMTYIPASTVQTTSIAVGVATVVTVEYSAIALRTGRSR